MSVGRWRRRMRLGRTLIPRRGVEVQSSLLIPYIQPVFALHYLRCVCSRNSTPRHHLSTAQPRERLERDSGGGSGARSLVVSLSSLAGGVGMAQSSGRGRE